MNKQCWGELGRRRGGNDLHRLGKEGGMVTSCHPEQPDSQRHMQKARKEMVVRTEKRGDTEALEPSVPTC